VVLGVVELHDLARDVGLEGAIVVCSLSVEVVMSAWRDGRTGEVGESGLGADKGHGGEGSGAGPEAGAEGGSGAEEGRRHGEAIRQLSARLRSSQWVKVNGSRD
jgi:hypothetical protein